MTVRQKRFGVWEEADASVLAPVTGPATTAEPVPGEELVLVDPTDDAERTWLAAAAASGAAVNIGDGASTLLADLREVQPTWLRARPEVWVQLRDEVERRAGDATWLGRLAYQRRLLVRGAVKRWLGMARVCRAETTGPLDPTVVTWFHGLGIDIDVTEHVDG
jgi:hypothetical protein